MTKTFNITESVALIAVTLIVLNGIATSLGGLI